MVRIADESDTGIFMLASDILVVDDGVEPIHGYLKFCSLGSQLL
jgi:hypothetical protein